MEENGYKFFYTCYAEMEADGKDMGVLVTGPKKSDKIGHVRLLLARMPHGDV